LINPPDHDRVINQIPFTLSNVKTIIYRFDMSENPATDFFIKKLNEYVHDHNNSIFKKSNYFKVDEDTIEVVNAQISNMEIEGAVFDRIYFDSCKFYGCRIQDSVFENCIFKNCHFVKCTIPYTTFHGCDFFGVDFQQSDLDHSLFESIVFERVRFQKCKLDEFRFYRVSFTGVLFDESLLATGTFDASSGEKFQLELIKSRVARCFFFSCNFQEVRFTDCNMNASTLSNCVLKTTVFQRCQVDYEQFCMIDFQTILQSQIAKEDLVKLFGIHEPDIKTYVQGMVSKVELYSVFISYSFLDSVVAQRVANSLRNNGVFVFLWEQDAQGGEKLKKIMSTI
jgi:fluoroquinolone resistance protein